VVTWLQSKTLSPPHPAIFDEAKDAQVKYEEIPIATTQQITRIGITTRFKLREAVLIVFGLGLNLKLFAAKN